jgi:hypothetical protein
VQIVDSKGARMVYVPEPFTGMQGDLKGEYLVELTMLMEGGHQHNLIKGERARERSPRPLREIPTVRPVRTLYHPIPELSTLG